ncbi:MAG TPA: carboxypeptidase-like regulatory domain-containing protein [Planctomycetota bacterium]|nr:carboxypeptidase-like regulatory domain-containing protein [Planctomycetota bacterium]
MTPAETVVTGIVVDETGAPVKGAVVFTAGWRGGTVIEKEEEIESVRAEPADEEGRFRLRLPGIRAGTIGVRARAPGLVLVSPGNSGYPLQIDVRQEARITLHRGVALHVRVTDAADGQPLAGARVAAYVGAGYTLHTWPPVDAAVTSAEGAADLVAPGGDVRVVAEAAGRAQREVLVRAAPPSAEAVVALGIGGRVKGTIIDPAGRPVAGARVVMLRAPCARAEATTDAGGRFHFEHVPPAGKEPEPIVAKRVVVLACDADGYGRQFLSCEPPSEGGEIEVRFALAELTTLEVHVRDARGSPVAGLRVSYGPEEGRVAWGWTTLRVARTATTDANGVFAATELPPGRVALRIPFDAEEPRYVEVPGSGPVEITMAASSVARRVRVRTVGGAPVVKATVRVWTPVDPGPSWRDRREGRTDADGLTTVSMPDVGPVTLVVDAPGGAIVAAPLAEGLRPDPIDVGLGNWRLEGRVLSLDGTPLRVHLAPVLWLELAGGGIEEVAGWRGAVETDVEGRFVFDRLAVDAVGVRVVGSGLSILEPEPILPGTPPVTLHALTPAQVTALTASAEVVDAVTGAALRDSAKVTAVATVGDQKATLLWSQNTGEHRAYAPLPPGEWTIRAEAEGYEPAEVRVTLAGSGSSPRPRIVLRGR